MQEQSGNDTLTVALGLARTIKGTSWRAMAKRIELKFKGKRPAWALHRASEMWGLWTGIFIKEV